MKTEQGEEKKREKGEKEGEKTKRKKEEKLVEKGKEEEEEEETERKECEESKGFECLICFEMMRWEKEPRSLPCGHSFCSDCLNKLFFSSQQTSTSTSTSESGDGDGGSDGGGGDGGPNLFLSPLQVGGSSSSSSSSSCCLSDGEKKKRCCPVCRKEIEGEGGGRYETIESFDSNYLIPETIDVIESSKIPSFCIPPTPCFSFLSFSFSCLTTHHKTIVPQTTNIKT